MHYYQVFIVSARTSQLRQAVTNCSLSNPSSLSSAGPNEGTIRGKNQVFNPEENTQTDTGLYYQTNPAQLVVCVSLVTHIFTTLASLIQTLLVLFIQQTKSGFLYINELFTQILFSVMSPVLSSDHYNETRLPFPGGGSR